MHECNIGTTLKGSLRPQFAIACVLRKCKHLGLLDTVLLVSGEPFAVRIQLSARAEGDILDWVPRQPMQ